MLPGKSFKMLLLLVLPLVVFAGTWHLVARRGPLWLSTYLDPSYAYLLNSLLLVEGQPPRLTEHPGTPVQTLGAGVIRLFHGGSPKQLTAKALQNPEKFLGEINLAFRALTAGSLLAGGLWLAWSLKSIGGALLFQAVPFLFIDSWMAGMRVTPETLLPTVTLGYCAALVVAGEKRIAGGSSWQLAVLAGFLGGLGVATKLTFIPLLALLLAVTCGRRQWLCAGAGGLGGLITGLLPMFPRMSETAHWVRNLVTHSGRYGKGDVGLVNPETYLRQLTNSVGDSMPFVFVVLLSAGVAIWGLRRLSSDPDAAARSRVLLGIALCQMAGLALVAKHPGRHYMVPLLFSTSLNAWHLFMMLTRHFPNRAMRWATMAFVLAMLIHAGSQFGSVRVLVAQCAERELATRERAQADGGGGLIAHYYSSSCVEYALHFANTWAHHYFGGRLKKHYPGSVFWNSFSGGFEDFSGKPKALPNVSDSPAYLMGAQSLEADAKRRDLLAPPGTHLALLWTSLPDTSQRLLYQRPTYFYRLESAVKPALNQSGSTSYPLASRSSP